MCRRHEYFTWCNGYISKLLLVSSILTECLIFLALFL